jgi:prepilin-type N-terminal cleavage/methylation domain-containing protein
MKRRAAFTLLELLVVIAIVAVIAAILFPVFASAKRSAKQTTAVSNVEQIGKAIQLYLNDHDDKLPARISSLPEWPGFGDFLIIDSDKPNGFDVFYGPYLKSSAVWFSPEDRLKTKGYTSFRINGQLGYSWSMSSIARPSEAIYLTDRTDIGDQPRPSDTYAWWLFIDTKPFDIKALPGTIDPVSVAAQIDPIRYVGNTAIYLFLDSHAKSMDFHRTWGNASQNLHLATKP